MTQSLINDKSEINRRIQLKRDQLYMALHDGKKLFIQMIQKNINIICNIKLIYLVINESQKSNYKK